MAPLSPVQVCEVFLAAMERLDADAFTALLDDDVILSFPYMCGDRPKRCVGRAEAEEFLKIIPALFATVRWVESKVYATDDPELAVIVATSAATLTTGDPYDNDYVLLLRVRDGRILEYREHFDPARAEPAFTAIGA
jgi:uncharacterized protein